MKEAFLLDSKGVERELGTSAENGLSQQEASLRLKKFGENKLAELPKPPWWMAFFAQFKDFVVLLLIAAAAVSFLLGEQIDALAIFAIVLLNAVIGFVQESRAEKALEALRKMVVSKARVVRGGSESSVDSMLLVPGDIVLLEAGDRIPADCRLVETASLETIESSLTGESTPVAKSAGAKVAANAGIADRSNMVFLGTAVARGLARAIVVSTGMHTEFGKIARQVQTVESGDTPLQRQLEEAGKKLSMIAVAIVGVVFAAGLLKGVPALEMFLTAVSLAVAAVPEGLPAIVTITLAIGVQRMARRNAIVRKLHAVETLGSATVICSDKTGTLTRNEMTVRKIVLAGGKSVEVTGAGYSLEGELLENGEKIVAHSRKELELAVLAGALCNTAAIEQTSSGVKALGDPTEVSLIVLSRKAALEVKNGSFKRIGELPFESERKLMSTLHDSSGKAIEGRFVSFTKGAPEVVLSKCSSVMKDGKIVPLLHSEKKALLEANNDCAKKALRVLAIAFKPFKEKPALSSKAVEEKMVFLALVAMIDPPREEARKAVALAKSAGIRVVMITGDNPLTAKAIAGELGIGDGNAVTGAELEELSEEKLRKLVASATVYARVSPDHKLRIVSALKANGEVVAMTGDGVNDAPALKKADIGIAMGITGTDVSKEASDLVLSDDNFASIVNAVEEGRVIYSNIVKSVRYLLSCNMGEILVLLLATLFLDAKLLPLLPIQILWMNLVTDGLPALALGMDPAEPDVMRQKPRSKHAQILDKSGFAYFVGIGALMALGTLALFAIELPRSPEKARTIAFTTLIFFQLFHSFNSRSFRNSLFSIGVFSNKALLLAVGVALALQVLVVHVGVLQLVFKTQPLTALDWLACFAVASSVFFAYEAYKLFAGKKQ